MASAIDPTKPADDVPAHYLDASAAGGGDGSLASPWNDWRTAVETAPPGARVRVSAKAGATVYDVAADFDGGPTAASHNVTFFADPDDLAAGRRPRIWCEGAVLAKFTDDPAGQWGLHDAASGTYRANGGYVGPGRVGGLYRAPNGRYGRLFDYGNDRATHEAYLLDTTQDPIASAQGSSGVHGDVNKLYAGPGVVGDTAAGHLSVRLGAPPPRHFCGAEVDLGSSPPTPIAGGPYAYPFDVAPYYAASPVSDGVILAVGHGTNHLLSVEGFDGWELRNIDFIGGHYAIRANGSTDTLVCRGCRFLAQVKGDRDDSQSGSTTRTGPLDLFAVNDFRAEWCSFHGGHFPHVTFADGKNYTGGYGASASTRLLGAGKSNSTQNFDGISFLSCRIEGFWSFIQAHRSSSGGLEHNDLNVIHCLLTDCAMPQGMLDISPRMTNCRFLHNVHQNSTFGGYIGGAGDGSCWRGFEVWVQKRARAEDPGWRSGAYESDRALALTGDWIKHGSPIYPAVSTYHCTKVIGDGPSFAINGAGTRPTASGVGLVPAYEPKSGTGQEYVLNNVAVLAPAGSGAHKYKQGNDSCITWLPDPANWNDIELDGNVYYRHPGAVAAGDVDTWVWVYKDSSTAQITTIAALRSELGGAHEANGDFGDPGFADDGAIYSAATIELDDVLGLRPAAGGLAAAGAVGVSGRGLLMADGHAVVAAPDVPWRGALEPDMADQRVGPL